MGIEAKASETGWALELEPDLETGSDLKTGPGRSPARGLGRFPRGFPHGGPGLQGRGERRRRPRSLPPGVRHRQFQAGGIATSGAEALPLPEVDQRRRDTSKRYVDEGSLDHGSLQPKDISAKRYLNRGAPQFRDPNRGILNPEEAFVRGGLRERTLRQ